MSSRKKGNSQDLREREALEVSAESLHRSAVRFRAELGLLREHANQLAQYVGNLAENARHLESESQALRRHAESVLHPSQRNLSEESLDPSLGHLKSATDVVFDDESES